MSKEIARGTPEKSDGNPRKLVRGSLEKSKENCWEMLERSLEKVRELKRKLEETQRTPRKYYGAC